MIDDVKTNQLREKIQKEREKLENTDAVQSHSKMTLVFLATFYLMFYGAQYLLLNKFGYIPFNMLETLVIFFAIRNLHRTSI